MGATLQLQGALYDTVTTVGALPYVVDGSPPPPGTSVLDQVVLITAGTGAVVLPLLAGPPTQANRELWILNLGAGTATVTPVGGNTINGAVAQVLVPGSFLRLLGRPGTDWYGTVGSTAGGSADILSFGADSVGAAAGTRFLYPWSSDGLAQTTSIPIIAQRGGTLKDFRVKHETAGGVGTITYTLQIEGVNTTITVSILSASTVMVSDLVNTIDVVAGNRITVETVKVGVGASPTDIASSVGFRVT
jgi:hypothetical protein